MMQVSTPPEIVRRITVKTDPVQLEKDIALLCDKALEWGAAEVGVIDKSHIRFSRDITADKQKASGFDSIHWPLHYPKDDIREAIKAFGAGIFFRVETGMDFPGYGGGPISDPEHRRVYKSVYEITARIESAAFYLGHHLALGLGAGNCRAVFCADEKRCRPMLRGGTCLHPNMGRPSVEAAGIEPGQIAQILGWTMNGKTGPLLAGLVMID